MVEATQWLLQTGVLNNISLKYQATNISYGDEHPALTGTFNKSVMCRHNYIMYVCMNYGTTYRFLRIGLINGKTEFLFDKTDGQLFPSSISSDYRYVGNILADDTYLYVSSGYYSNSVTIMKIDINTGEVRSFTDTNTGDSHKNTGGGVMFWDDDMKIHIMVRSGPLVFDTSAEIFDTSLLTSSSFASDYTNDITKTKYHYIYHTCNSSSLKCYNILTKTDTTITLPASMYTCGAYDGMNDKIYLLGKTSESGKLYTMTETGSSISIDPESEAMPWLGSNSDLLCAALSDNGMLYVFRQNSDLMHIYNTKTKTYHTTRIQFKLPSETSNYGITFIRPIVYGSMVFIPYTTMGYFMYVVETKYNVGFKNDKQLHETTNDYASQFVYDPNVIEFKNMYMTIKNGTMTKNMEPLSDESNIKKTHMSKTEYRHLISAIVKKST